MGTVSDMKTRTENLREESNNRISLVQRARNLIYNLGYAVGSKAVELILKSESWTPTLVQFRLGPGAKLIVPQNAFSWIAATGAPSIFRMLNVDLMHEWQLGVWKALFAHLIRILHTQGYNAIVELNRRSVCHMSWLCISLVSSDIERFRHLGTMPYDAFRKTLLICLG